MEMMHHLHLNPLTGTIVSERANVKPFLLDPSLEQRGKPNFVPHPFLKENQTRVRWYCWGATTYNYWQTCKVHVPVYAQQYIQSKILQRHFKCVNM